MKPLDRSVLRSVGRAKSKQFVKFNIDGFREMYQKPQREAPPTLFDSIDCLRLNIDPFRKPGLRKSYQLSLSCNSLAEPLFQGFHAVIQIYVGRRTGGPNPPRT